MYRRDAGRHCLEQSISDVLELSLVTQPVVSEDLEAYEVSTIVNSPENDSPECVRRVSSADRIKLNSQNLTVEIISPADFLGAIARRQTNGCTTRAQKKQSKTYRE
jgi:hypothetical protein